MYGFILTTTVSAGRSVSMQAPGDVKPGAIMLAPLRMNFIAPLSTCSFGNKLGSARIKCYSYMLTCVIIMEHYNNTGYAKIV